LDKLRHDLNEFVERFRWQDADLDIVHNWLKDEHASAAPNVSLTLRQWHGCKEPRRAFYGLASADDLAALYEKHGKVLFERNIRHYLGAQAVNKAIQLTARERPADLFYLNNGLTVVCTKATLLPGASNEAGTFQIEGFSVVNGAQTVGSLDSIRRSDGGVAPAARVMVTIIEVGEDADSFGPAITRARNTQNAVRGAHFAALDPNQERLRREMAVSGISYYYRPSDEATRGGSTVVTMERAAVALGALSRSIATAVAAKKESGQLYDRTGSFYPKLFSDGLSGVGLCRRVRIFDFLDEAFEGAERSSSGPQRTLYRHGRYFIATILARRLPTVVNRPEIDISATDTQILSRTALELAELIHEVAQLRYGAWPGYLSIFRNLTSAEPLAAQVMQELATRDALAASLSTGPSSPVSPEAGGQ
jgi:hypothetical protein